MRHDGSSFGGEAHPSDRSDPGLAAREPYLRRVLEAFEDGRLQPYDYTRRVLAINAATSTDQMAAIVDQPPDTSPEDSSPAPHRGLDAVDLALLRSQRISGPRPPTARYVTLAVVFVLFALLIGIGMWLASHVPATGSSTAGAVSGVFAWALPA